MKGIAELSNDRLVAWLRVLKVRIPKATGRFLEQLTGLRDQLVAENERRSGVINGQTNLTENESDNEEHRRSEPGE